MVITAFSLGWRLPAQVFARDEFQRVVDVLGEGGLRRTSRLHPVKVGSVTGGIYG